MSARILIVDDDPSIRDVIGFAMEQAGFVIALAEDGTAALASARRTPPDLVVLDIGLPEMDGFDVCRELRKSSDVPILFLTARDDEIDRVLGLELGGDDYVTKPFSPRELIARTKAILKRATRQVATGRDRLHWGAVMLDQNRHECTFDGVEVILTGSEITLLTALMSKPQHVMSRGDLINAVYGPNIHVSDRTVDSHLRNIRQKFADAGCKDVITTVHGVGLRMGACTRS
ncbi:MAG: response regulator transcription factor [Pseudomonadota bacterium]